MAKRVSKKEMVRLTVRHCHRVEPQRNFLKYYRIVKHWAKVKHGLSSSDLEMLYFLYSENLFSVKDFERYENIFPWDKVRFKRQKRDGWVVKWRKEGMDYNRWALYDLSPKAKRVLDRMYKMLNGEEDFPMNLYNTPKARREAGFVDKTISMAMQEINKASKKERLTPVYSRRDGAR